jgi:hypothetical protein
MAASDLDVALKLAAEGSKAVSAARTPWRRCTNSSLQEHPLPVRPRHDTRLATPLRYADRANGI